MSRILPVLLAGLLASCGSTPEPPPPAGLDAATPLESDCTNRADDDLDGKTDCDDPDCDADSECKIPVPTTCGLQRDCGDIVNELISKVCLDAKCVPPGEQTRKGEAVAADVTFDLVITPSPTKPQTSVVRFVFPTRADGTSISCADLVALGNCKDSSTRSKIDQEGQLNQVFRVLYNLNFSSGSTFTVPASVPKGASYILYGETWSGPRDSSDTNNPTGLCAARFCVEGQNVPNGAARYRLTF